MRGGGWGRGGVERAAAAGALTGGGIDSCCIAPKLALIRLESSTPASINELSGAEDGVGSEEDGSTSVAALLLLHAAGGIAPPLPSGSTEVATTAASDTETGGGTAAVFGCHCAAGVCGEGVRGSSGGALVISGCEGVSRLS